MEPIVPRRISSTLTAALACAILLGCSAGPRILQGNRTDYNHHLQASNKEELLMNLVRIRYLEPPLFMQVSSISANFGINTNVSVSGMYQNGLGFPHGSTVTGMAGYGFLENPTIIYAPIQGKQYAQRMLTEVSMSNFVLLARGGWSVRYLIKVLAIRIGGLDNQEPFQPVSGMMDTAENDRRFSEFTELIKAMEVRGDLEFVGIDQSTQGSERGILQLSFKDASERDTFEHLLGVNISETLLPSGRIVATIQLTPVRDLMDQPDVERDTVPLKLKNVFEVFWSLSAGINVPEEDLASGRALRVERPLSNLDTTASIVPRMHIKYSDSPPKNAYAAVNVRGHWFYIDDSDADSKLMLMLLSSVYSLQTEPVPAGQPLLTLPVSK